MTTLPNPEIVVYVRNVDRFLIAAAHFVLLYVLYIINKQKFRMQFSALTFKLQLGFHHQDSINNIIYNSEKRLCGHNKPRMLQEGKGDR